MSRIICGFCGRDLGPADTSEDTHGICDKCGAKLLGITEEEFRERVSSLKPGKTPKDKKEK